MIRPGIICYPFALFILIFVLHILIWRVRRPEKQIISMFLIFVIIPDFLILAFFCVSQITGIGLLVLKDMLLILLLYTGLAGVYIQTYPSIQAGSPSLLIVHIIGRSKEPSNKKEIRERIQVENFIDRRLADLEAEKLIRYREKDGSVTITRKGLILSDIFILYRRFIGMEEGKG